MTALDMFPETKAPPVPAEDQNRRYTPRAFMEWIRAKAGVEAWDLRLRVAFVLPGNRHEQPFWQEHVEPFRDGRAARFGYRLDCHFPPGRQAYAKPGSNGVPVGSADFPSCLLVWRRS